LRFILQFSLTLGDAISGLRSAICDLQFAICDLQFSCFRALRFGRRPAAPRPSHRIMGRMTKDRGRTHLPEIIREVVDSYSGDLPINNCFDAGLPSETALVAVLNTLRSVLYAGYFGQHNVDRSNIQFHLADSVYLLYEKLSEQIYRGFRHGCRLSESICSHCQQLSEKSTVSFLSKIPQLRRRLALDVQAAYDGDPAAKSFDEIISSYPGFQGITVHRVAHELHRLGVPLIPRIMSEYAHSQTGIDIHPGARIGDSFFIDHGTGVVIGETAEIGNNVKIYQGVTLGALSFPKDASGKVIRDTKRHPTIEDDVVIYSGATILGGETVIGRSSVIGGNVWITHSIPPHTKVTLETPRMNYQEAAAKESKV
jgi:serine O-acetyltransferase